MDEILKRSLLYDFYGELLTKHQKEIYEQFILDDLSLSEIAAAAGISRQGVHDLIKRCSRALQEYEDKLHLVERFISIKKKIYKMEAAAEEFDGLNTVEFAERIRQISSEIIEEL